MYDFFRCGISSRSLIEFVGQLSDEDPIVAIPYFHSITFETIEAYPGRIDLLGCFHDEPQFGWSPVSVMLRQARRVFFMAEEEKDLVIRNYGPSHGRFLVESPVVGMGAELDPDARALLAAPDLMRDIRTRLDVPDEYFITVGRKDNGKGLEKLLGWYSDFAQECTDPPPLVFLGPGPKDAIPIDSEFIDCGFVTEEEKFALLSGAICSINLSTNEAFSLVLMESWLAGTPVVVPAQCPVTSGHCRRSAGGIAISDRAEFRAALATFRDPELRLIAGNSGQHYVRRDFNWDRVTDSFTRALGSI